MTSRIDDLVVPPVVEEGEDQVVLECPFTFTQEEEREDQLELKWYFNDSPAPFYQVKQGPHLTEKHLNILLSFAANLKMPFLYFGSVVRLIFVVAGRW